MQVLFPPFPFQHAVETEGLGKVALAMGYQAWGMPLVEVEHK
jgi:mannan polymerase complexes MNN9 subunit